MNLVLNKVIFGLLLGTCTGALSVLFEGVDSVDVRNVFIVFIRSGISAIALNGFASISVVDVVGYGFTVDDFSVFI